MGNWMPSLPLGSPDWYPCCDCRGSSGDLVCSQKQLPIHRPSWACGVEFSDFHNPLLRRTFPPEHYRPKNLQPWCARNPCWYMHAYLGISEYIIYPTGCLRFCPRETLPIPILHTFPPPIMHNLISRTLACTVSNADTGLIVQKRSIL